jgi:hypothetical protein
VQGLCNKALRHDDSHASFDETKLRNGTSDSQHSDLHVRVTWPYM